MSPKPCVSYTIGFDVYLITSSSLMNVTKFHLQQLIDYVLKLCKIIARLLRDFSRLTILQKTKRDNKTRKIGIDSLCFGMWFYFRIHYQVIYLFIFFCRWQMYSEQQAPKSDRFVTQLFTHSLILRNFCYSAVTHKKYIHVY